MGFIYRKSLKAGPFRINLSMSGVGMSTGAPGYLPGVDLATDHLAFTVIRGAVLRNFEATTN